MEKSTEELLEILKSKKSLNEFFDEEIDELFFFFTFGVFKLTDK